jgi:hypothetical protein
MYFYITLICNFTLANTLSGDIKNNRFREANRVKKDGDE